MNEEKKNNNGYEIEITENDEKDMNQNESLDQDFAEQKNDREDLDLYDQESSDENKYLNQLLRLKAEFANYKKRVEKERLELSGFIKSELVLSLLPVLDDFELMLDHTNNEDNELLKGIKLIYTKLLDALKEHGLKPIEAVGKKFDPYFHEAVLIETGEDGEDDVVAEEWRKGYLFKDKLIRPAQVKVIKSEKAYEN